MAVAGFQFQRTEKLYPASKTVCSFMPNIKLSWRRSDHYQHGLVGSD